MAHTTFKWFKINYCIYISSAPKTALICVFVLNLHQLLLKLYIFWNRVRFIGFPLIFYLIIISLVIMLCFSNDFIFFVFHVFWYFITNISRSDHGRPHRKNLTAKFYKFNAFTIGLGWVGLGCLILRIATSSSRSL